MKGARKNVIYTCSIMLIFENRKKVKHWSGSRCISEGNIQLIENI